MKKFIYLGIIYAIFSALGISDVYAKEKRDIVIVFNCTSKQFTYQIGNDKPTSLRPLLTKNDYVLIQAIKPIVQGEKIAIEYEIKGDDPTANIKNFFDAFLKPAPVGKPAVPVIEETYEKEVEKKLLPGGSLVIGFYLQKDQEKTLLRSTYFDVEDEYPTIILSSGIAFTTNKIQSLELIDTNKTVTYQQEGNTITSKMKKLAYINSNNTFRPKESLIEYIHFHLGGPFYVTAGVPINTNFFKEPILGASYFLKYGASGFLFSVIVKYEAFTEIDPSSGYEENQDISPAEGLTIDKIKTLPTPGFGFGIGISYKF